MTNTTIFLQIITAPTLQNWFSITWWYFNLEAKPVIQRCEFCSSQYWEENMRTWLSALFPSTVLQKMFFFTAFFSYCYWLISYHTHCGERFLNLQLRTVIYNRNNQILSGNGEIFWMNNNVFLILAPKEFSMFCYPLEASGLRKTIERFYGKQIVQNPLGLLKVPIIPCGQSQLD